jgi:hypothetical protein
MISARQELAALRQLLIHLGDGDVGGPRVGVCGAERKTAEAFGFSPVVLDIPTASHAGTVRLGPPAGNGGGQLEVGGGQ